MENVLIELNDGDNYSWVYLNRERIQSGRVHPIELVELTIKHRPKAFISHYFMEDEMFSQYIEKNEGFIIWVEPPKTLSEEEFTYLTTYL